MAIESEQLTWDEVRRGFEKTLERARPEFIRPETVLLDNIRACDALCSRYPTSEISAEILLWHPDWGKLQRREAKVLNFGAIPSPNIKKGNKSHVVRKPV